MSPAPLIASTGEPMPEAWTPHLAMPDECAILWPHALVPDVAAAPFRKASPEYARAVSRAEVFEFGSVPLDDVEPGKLQYVIELFHGEFIDIPYPVVMYRFNSTVADGALVVDRMPAESLDDDDDARDTIRHYRLTYFGRAPSGQGYILVGMATAIFLRSHVNEVGILFFPSAHMREAGDKEYPFADAVGDEQPRTMNARLRWDIGYLFLRCTLLLATDGIPRRVENPSRLINAHRKRKGKPLVPRVTHIDFRQYLDALNAGPPGHHASPVPHLRRGHIRRLEDGRRVWVRDCLVNARADVKTEKRERYTVHREPGDKPPNDTGDA